MTTILTRAIVRLLLPASFVTAAAVLVKGYAGAGDGFSAGVIAATGVLLQYVAFGVSAVEARLPVQLAPRAVVMGLGLVLAVAFGPCLAGLPPLSHFPRPGAHVVTLGALELHTAVLLDVGIFLVVLGFGVRVLSAVAHAGAAE
ncbi:MAG TPA: MnhB domain-containing protein [Candidatus Tectomicrobia bacterium]|nr:MnhB domain-containing protein [Candidatus Tectomicrobia bacterium]